ncbi:FAD-dependent monooxygenase [Candidatus Berkelbacteria bacterium]|nr:FAD-dependent monooxygenase [Candidatus Berkelbacteria bacterium]
MKKNAAIAIVGGGLVGPMTELLLRRAGFTNVTTYEAAPATSSRGGGLIGLEASAYPVLAEAGIPLGEIDALQTSEIDVYNMDPRGIGDVSERFTYNGINTTWDLFHAAIARRVAIHYGQRVTNLSANGKRAVLSFKDGTTKNADLVIFADGKGSVGRTLLDSERLPDYQGYVVWRGLTKPPEPLPRCFARYCDKSTGVLVAVSSPIRQGQSAGLCDWALYENMPAERFKRLAGDMPQRRPYIFPRQVTTDLRRHFEHYARGSLPPFLADALTKTPDVSLVPINDMPAPDQAVWRKGKAGVVLLGDALMSVRPHTGRGLNNGLEQALQLVHQLSSSPVGKAFEAWQKETTGPLGAWITLGKQRGADFGLGVN